MKQNFRKENLLKHIKNTLIFLFVTFVGYIAFSENYFAYLTLTGLPVQNIEKLFVFHMIANASLFLGTGYLSILFFKIYKKLKVKEFPFIGFIWIFGAFKAFLSAIFLMNTISIWRAYYWIDGTVRIFAGLFVLASSIMLTKSYKQIVSIKSPSEYAELSKEIKRILDIREEVINTKLEKNAE